MRSVVLALALGNLCDESLFITYKGDWRGRTVNTAEGSWRLDPGEWDDFKIVTKKSKVISATGVEECSRTYTANCAESAIFVKKTCETSCQGEDECIEKRTLKRTVRSAWVISTGTSLDVDGEEYAMEVYDPDWQSQKWWDPEQKKWANPEGEFAVLTRDTKVKWVASKSDGGVKLTDIPRGSSSWKAPTGCYCCKHSYHVLSNPFANMNGAHREAWDGPSGDTECMLAWADLPQDTIWDLLPRALVMLVDRLTLTVGSHAACRASCAGVSNEFMMHKHSYMKLQEQYY